MYLVVNIMHFSYKKNAGGVSIKIHIPRYVDDDSKPYLQTTRFSH